MPGINAIRVGFIDTGGRLVDDFLKPFSSIINQQITLRMVMTGQLLVSIQRSKISSFALVNS